MKTLLICPQLAGRLEWAMGHGPWARVFWTLNGDHLTKRVAGIQLDGVTFFSCDLWCELRYRPMAVKEESREESRTSSTAASGVAL